MTSNGQGENLQATLNQGLHRHFRHKNANHFPPPSQAVTSPSLAQPQSTPGSSPESEDDYMPILEGYMGGDTGASRHRRQMSAAYRGVEYALSPTLKSPSIVFPRHPSPLSPQYYQRTPYQPQTPVYDAVRLQSPTPLYSKTQAFRHSQEKHKPAPLRLQADSPTLGHWTHYEPSPSPLPSTYLLDGTDNGDDSDDEFPIRPSAALLPHKEQEKKAGPAPRRPLPDLLQDVLEIMNSITSQQNQLEEESLALQDMVELVCTMQEQADSLMEYSDLVEEYVDMVNDEVTMSASPTSAYSIDTVDLQEETEGDEDGAYQDPGVRELASRADSGVSVGDDTVADYEDNHVTESQPRATAGVVSDAPGKAKHTSREPQFRDSGLGLMSPDMASPGTRGRGRPAPSRGGRNARSSRGRGVTSRLSGR